MKKTRSLRKAKYATRRIFRQRQLSALLLQLFATGLFVSSPAHARTGVATPPANALPVPSTNAARPFVYAGSANVATSGNAMTVTSATRTTGLNWNSFNVGSSASVTFNQPDAGSRVVNNIWSNDPSVILGQVSSNGQIYLFNQNGILFGNGAQVNVGGLVASALSTTGDILGRGLPGNKGDTLSFYWAGDVSAFKDSTRNFVAVDPGANITTPSGSKVLLLAPVVENNGTIRTGQGGEAILAGGGNVLLTAPGDPNLRGLLVQVTPFTGKDSNGVAVSLDGAAANRAGATIDTSKDGVVTLAAMAVNQEGTVRAGKAVNLNGEILLVSGSNKTPKINVTPTADAVQVNWMSGFDQASAKQDADVTPDGKQTIEISQSGSTLQIDWTGGFNVAQGQTVAFTQPTAGAVAYNFVNDPSRSVMGTGGRSLIDGGLTANGQVFLINEKGIDFGSQASVKASNFVASALGMNPDIVTNGLLSLNGYSARAFYLRNAQWLSSEIDAAQSAFSEATVNVAAGAAIGTSDNGYAMLLGSAVNQQGVITTPKGQTLLAAGADAYLKFGYSSGMRGFTAEVNPLYTVPSAGSNWTAISHGTVNNSGTITSVQGDISLVGFDITQSGILAATTGAQANGSIHLVARDQVATGGSADSPTPFSRHVSNGVIADYVNSGTEEAQKTVDKVSFINGQNAGTVTFSAGGQTAVFLDGSDNKTVNDGQLFIPSAIDVLGRAINVAGASAGRAGAFIAAKGGKIRFAARDSFSADGSNAFAGDPVKDPTQFRITQASGAGIFVGSGATLDVSGAVVQKSVADLFIHTEFFGSELANNPLQRNGVLYKKTAQVDARDGVSIADISGWIGKMERTVEEKSSTGGTISLHSIGNLAIQKDAVLDVSGGNVNYAAGMVTESRLVTAGGLSYRLNDAPSNLTYTSLVNITRREAGYQVGKSAGTVELVGQNIALSGILKANTTRGVQQRNPTDPAVDPYRALPYGGKLVVVDAGQHYQPTGNSVAEQAAAYRQAQMVFINGRSTVADGLSSALDSIGPRLELSSSLLDAGFSRFDLTSDGRIDIPADVKLSLAAGGSFLASGRQVYVGGSISAPNGSIALTTKDFSTVGGPTASIYSTLVVDSGATLSTAGRWVNDYLSPDPASQQVLALNGGTITLTSAYDVDLRSGSRLDVSGGGQVKTSAALVNGNAGSITLTSGGVSKGGFDFTDVLDRRDASVFLDGTLTAYALGAGGKLEIDTSKVVLGNHFTQDSRNWSRAQRLDAGQAGVALDASFLNQGGFYSFKFVGRDGVAVLDGIRLAPTPLSWSLIGNGSYKYKATGTALDSFAQKRDLQGLRTTPTSVALATTSINYGDLTVGKGAYVGVDPLGSIQLDSFKQLSVLGTLEARGGLIRLSRSATTGDNGLSYSEQRQSESIYLGAQSLLLAGGTTIFDASTQNYMNAGLSADVLRSQGLYRGKVVDGGRVELYAGQGYLITREGALIDVSGTSNTLSVAGASGLAYTSRTVGSAGGQVNMMARDGMLLDGRYLATGANGAPGGIFNLRFTDAANSSDPWQVGSTLPSGALKTALMGSRILDIYQSSGSHQALWPGLDESLYLAGNAVLTATQYNGKASVDVGSLNQGGFGSWYLSSQNEMHFSGKVNATVANQMRLDAATYTASDNTSVNLAAAAVQMGNYGDQTIAATFIPATGKAEFTLSGLDVGLVGNFSMSGFGTSKFVSSGDIHFDSMPNGAANRSGGSLYNGQLKGTGSMEFSAARLSPATFSDFTVDLSSDTESKLTISRNGSPAGALLSVDGRIEFKANTILDKGTVVAPLGQIAFTSPNGTVTLDSDSVTSVMAEGLLPLGMTTQSGRIWNYQASAWSAGNFSLTNLYTVTAPDKAITVDAANSNLASGAKINLSGGGEAFAYEFASGKTGTVDILKQTGVPGTFTILPSWTGAFAPADAQAQAYYNVSNPRTVGTSTTYDNIPSLKPGDQIQLAANAYGLVGNYTLLPASYALLPGAYLVTLKGGSGQVVTTGQTQADGSQLVTATRFAANANGSYAGYAQQPLTVEVASQSVVQQRASYITTTATDAFFDSSRLAGDAGRLSVVGRQSLSFDPAIAAIYGQTIRANDGRQRAGKGAEVDLAALKMAVVDAAFLSNKDESKPDVSGMATVSKEKLNALGVSSLLLGGVRSSNGTGESIKVVAQTLDVVTLGDQALGAKEVMLAATDAVTVHGNAKMTSTGDIAATDYTIGGDGAFLRVAGGGQSLLTRSGTLSRNKGNLSIEENASIQGRSVMLDATKDNTFAAGTITLLKANASDATGGNIAIGAKRINVMGDETQRTDGLTLSKTSLTGFSTADQIRLTSYSTIDFYSDKDNKVSLGNESLRELDINAAGIAGHGGAATLQAKSIRFGNTNPDPTGKSYDPGPDLKSGTLVATADNITFGGNATQTMRDAGNVGFALRGFSGVTLNANQQIRFEGIGVTAVDNSGGDNSVTALTLNAGHVVAGSASDHLLRASGVTSVTGGGVSDALGDVGGSLALQGSSVNVSGRIETPAGKLTLTATGGAATDNVTVTGTLRAEGVSKAFGDTYAYAPAGQIALSSASGDVVIANPTDKGGNPLKDKDGKTIYAKVSVNGADGGGDAGTLSLTAKNGSVTTAAGTLLGSASADDTSVAQGTLAVDAGNVALDTLATAVTNGKDVHFRGKWDVRVRNGDLSLSDKITIKSADVTLSADKGNVTIAGTVDASGAAGGSITLNAKSATDSSGTHGGIITLASTGKLLAKAEEYLTKVNGTNGRGGNVTLGVDGVGSKITLNKDSEIDVSVAKRQEGVDANGNPRYVDSVAPLGHVLLRAPRTFDTSAGATNSTVTSTSVASRLYTVSSGSMLTAGQTFLFTSAGAGEKASIVAYNLNGIGDFKFNTVFDANTANSTANQIASKDIPAQDVTLIYDGASYWVARIGTTSYLPQTAPTATSSTTNAFVLTMALNPNVMRGYTTGEVIFFAVPKNYSSVGAKPVTIALKSASSNTPLATKALLKSDGSAITSSADLKTGVFYYAIYDGNSFRIFGTGSVGAKNTSFTAVAAATSPAATVGHSDSAFTTMTVKDGPSTYGFGSAVTFKADKDASGMVSLDVSGLGTKNLYLNGQLVDGTGKISKDQLITAIYDGSGFQWITDAGTGVAIDPIKSTINGISKTSPVVVDAFKTYSEQGNVTVDATHLGGWQSDNFAFMSNATSIESSLGNLGKLVSLRPGIELRVSANAAKNMAGNITVGADIDFNGATQGVNYWRYGTDATPGTLMLRAEGSLNLNSVISDGFTVSTTTQSNPIGTGTNRDGKQLSNGDSWSYALVAGADITAANPLAVKANIGAASGNVNLNSSLVRTGAGNIKIAAQGDVVLANGAAVYTAGVTDSVAPSHWVSIPGSDQGDNKIDGRRDYFPINGGDMSIAAGGSIIGTNQGSISDWLIRYSSTFNDTQWYPRIASFSSGFGIFGGGNLSLTAGKDITGVTAVVPTNGRVPGENGQAQPDLARINGGGNLSVAAGGSITGGSYYAETGQLNLAAGGNIASDNSGHSLDIALGSTAARLTAGGNIALHSASNPLAWVVEAVLGDSNQTGFQGVAYKDSGGNVILNSSGSGAYAVALGTYSDLTSLDVVSVGGAAVLGSPVGTGVNVQAMAYMAPSQVRVATFSDTRGDISAGLSQIPGHEGQLDLLSSKGLNLADITQYDTPISLLPSLSNIVHGTAIGNTTPIGVNPFSAAQSLIHSPSLWHSSDITPSHLVALNGDINGPGRENVVQQFDEPVRVMASGNIQNSVSIVSQHINATDVSSIVAGGSITMPTLDLSKINTQYGSGTKLQVNGPGRLEVIAGNNIDLGNSVGILTTGNQENFNLPEGGASIYLLAGGTPDYKNFRQYLGADLQVDNASLRNLFFSKLREEGKAANYGQGRTLINALFPEGSVNGGYINLFASELKTQQGGNIDMLVPGGTVTVGIAEGGSKKPPADQGVFTVQGGDVRAYVSDSFLVAKSRVFTLFGGNILVWADQGSIDAGKGSKTVSATPPPVLVARNGKMELDTSGAISGSGIGALASRDNTPPSDLDLFAPNGAIDAGDAGLRSTGNVTLGARVVLNAANIQAAGAVSGAPPVVASAPAAASGNSASTAAQKKDSSPLEGAQNQNGGQGLLTVEVLAAGDTGAGGATIDTPNKDDGKEKKKSKGDK